MVILLNRGQLSEQLLAAGVSVKIIDETEHGFLALLAKLVTIGRQFWPHYIHTHRHKEHILGAVAALMLPGCVSLRTIHGVDEHPASWRQPGKRLRKQLDTTVGRFLQRHIVCVSADLKNEVSNLFPAQQLTVIENGIDVTSVENRARQNRPNLPSNLFKIALIGRVVPVKRVDLFLAIAVLAQQRGLTHFVFYVVGDGPLLIDAKKFVAQNGLRNITFTGFSADAVSWLACMDALCVTSDHEGLPMVMLEAMVLKVPVVARAVGGIGTALSNEKGSAVGVLMNSINPAAFIEAFEYLRSHATLGEQMVDNARCRVNHRFSVNKMAERYLALYREP